VFFALGEDEGEDVSARSEQLLLVIWLAGMGRAGAGSLSPSRALSYPQSDA
jgi:hypothetical protein